MNLQQKLRDLQDARRNAGWRIAWIPWQEPGKPEVVRGHPLALVGAGVFVGTIALLGHGPRLGLPFAPSLPLLLSLLIGSLALTLLGSVYAAVRKQADWRPITARCVDRELGEIAREPGEIGSSWDYRLLCEFTFRGRTWRVTPEASHLVAFRSRARLERYLAERIARDGRCRLWVNPRNPLQCIFHRRRWWL